MQTHASAKFTAPPHTSTKDNQVTASIPKAFWKRGKTYSQSSLNHEFMSPFLFMGLMSCTSCNAVLHWPKYTPHPVQLLWTYQVSRLAIHISVSLAMTINAVARTDAAKRQIPATANTYDLTSHLQDPTPGINTPISYCLTDCVCSWRCFLSEIFHFELKPMICICYRLHLDAVVRFAL